MPSEERTPSSADQLADAIPHLAFEQAAMRASAERFLTATTPDRFAFEAFLVHTRVLRAFYLDKWSRRNQWAETTVLAELYFPRRAGWRDVKGSRKTPRLTATKDALDKQLAHLTTDRAQAFNDLQPEVARLRGELDDLWQLFLTTLEKYQDTAVFRRALDEKCRELALG